MPTDSLITLTILAATAAFTPGPNNALVASSGVNFGYRRSLPHIMGIAFGFSAMIFIVGLFLGELFQRSLLLREILRWTGVALLLFVAWKLARSGGIGSKSGTPRPFKFVEAAAFQWVNPKGWAMAIAITAQFASDTASVQTALIVALIFIVVGLTSASAWALLGQSLRRWLDSPRRLSLFNHTMAVLIAACVVMLFLD